MATLRADAILFDMDGTLIDESESYREAIRLTAEFLLRLPVTSEEVAGIKRMAGFNNDWDATWALVGERRYGSIVLPGETDRASPAYRRLQDIFQTYYLGDRLWRDLCGRPAPFLWHEPLILRETPLIRPDTLDWLRRFAIGIATSRPRVEALMALRQHGHNAYFREDALVAAEDAPFEKPHPAPLLTLAAKLGCHHAVYVGDTINDAIAALAAGMPFILISAFPLSDPAVDSRVYARLRSVNDLPTVCYEL